MNEPMYVIQVEYSKQEVAPLWLGKKAPGRPALNFVTPWTSARIFQSKSSLVAFLASYRRTNPEYTFKPQTINLGEVVEL